MQAAPPVAVRCTAGGPWRALQTVLFALAAGVFVFWVLSTWAAGASAGLRAVLPLAAALATAGLAWRHSWQPARTLAWDGQHWTLEGRPGGLQLMIDLGQTMLLRHGGQDWLAVSRADVGPAWHGLRVAVLAQGDAGSSATTNDGWPNA